MLIKEDIAFKIITLKIIQFLSLNPNCKDDKPFIDQTPSPQEPLIYHFIPSTLYNSELQNERPLHSNQLS